MRSFTVILFLVFFSAPVCSQQITYSDYDRDDARDMNFEIIGKMNGNFLVYKNLRWKHRLVIFDNEMNTKEIIPLAFFPEKTLNVDFVTYPDHFFMVYQYQKNSIVHCMSVKMDGQGKKLSEPVELDTTRIPFFDENKIYSTIFSEDKQQIMVFKIQKKSDRISFVTLLFDHELQLVKKTRQTLDYEFRSDNYRDFSLDNDGNFVFTLDKSPVNRDYSNVLKLVTKAPQQDTFEFHTISLGKKYINNVSLKIDNLNHHYLINSFYSNKNRGSMQGLFTSLWDQKRQQESVNELTEFTDSLRAEARRDGSLKIAFDDFVIRQQIVKKDGGFLMVAEDFSSQSLNNFSSPMNPLGYYGNPYSLSPNSYYYYNPYYGNYYRPFTSSSGYNNTRFYYDNLVVFSMDKTGKPEWERVIPKQQVDDGDDNFLSYSTFNSGGEIHFLFNMDKKNQIITDQGIDPYGNIRRNATLKSLEKGYQFMTRFGKQVATGQLLLPCLYRGYICFAKVDY
jgi:hypothetical protein